MSNKKPPERILLHRKHVLEQQKIYIKFTRGNTAKKKVNEEENENKNDYYLTIGRVGLPAVMFC